MAWSREDDESFSELFEDWEQVAPSIEATFARDAELEALRERVKRLERLVGEKPEPEPEFRTGCGNPLLSAVKERSK